MARYPGTETQHNRSGLKPGQLVRCRRSRANASRSVSDRRGFVVEVRPGHARVLLDPRGETIWLESESFLAETETADSDLERFRQAYLLLAGQRLELDDECWTIFSPGFPAAALDAAKAVLGNRLLDLEILAHGVSELALRLSLAAPQPLPTGDGGSHQADV
jgi:hypothetical protein